MKSLYYILLVLLFLAQTTLCLGEARFNKETKDKMIKSILESNAESAQDKKAEIKTSDVKNALDAGLSALLMQKKIDLSEKYQIISVFDANFGKKEKARKDELKSFLKQAFDLFNNEMQLSKDREECNWHFCKDKLQCATRLEDRSAPTVSCSKDDDCQTKHCLETKVCEQIKVCYLPAHIGESCTETVCAINEGILCAPINIRVAKGSCIADGTKEICKNDFDCCSNSCQKGSCVSSTICKKACSVTKTSKETPECCVPYIDVDGKCSLPPTVPPGLNSTSVKNKSLINLVAEFLINSASAGSDNIGGTPRAVPTATTEHSAQIDLGTAYSTEAQKHCEYNGTSTPASGTFAGRTCVPGSDAASIYNAAKANCDGFHEVCQGQGDNRSCHPVPNCNAQQLADLETKKTARDNAATAWDNAKKDLDKKMKGQTAARVTSKLKHLEKVTEKYGDPEKGFAKKSDIANCHVNLAEDFRILLQQNSKESTNSSAKPTAYNPDTMNYFELEMAMTAFDFVNGGRLTYPRLADGTYDLEHGQDLNPVNDDLFIGANSGLSINKRLHDAAIVHAKTQRKHIADLQLKSKQLECECFKIKIELYSKLPIEGVDPRTRESVKLGCKTDDDRNTLDGFLALLTAGKPSAAMADADGTKAAHFLTVMSGLLGDVTTNLAKNSIETQTTINQIASDFNNAISEKRFQDRLEDVVSLYHPGDKCYGDGWFDKLFGTNNPPDVPANVALGEEDPAWGEVKRFLLHSAWKDRDTNDKVTPPYMTTEWTSSKSDSFLGIFTEVCFHLHTKFTIPKIGIGLDACKGKNANSSACINNIAKYVESVPAVAAAPAITDAQGTVITPAIEAVDAYTQTNYLIDPPIPVSYPADTPKVPANCTASGSGNARCIIPATIDLSDVVPSGESVITKVQSAFNSGKQWLLDHRNDAGPARADLTREEMGHFLPDYTPKELGEDEFVNTKFKMNAKLFAIEQGLLTANGTTAAPAIPAKDGKPAVPAVVADYTKASVQEADDLEKFAKYALTYHYLLPKRNKINEIGYDPDAFGRYLDTIANGITALASSNLLDKAGAVVAQHIKYGNYEAQLLQTYPAAPGSPEAMAQSARIALLGAANTAFQQLKSGQTVAATTSSFSLGGGIGASTATHIGSSTAGANNSNSTGGTVGTISNLQNAIAKYNQIRNGQLQKMEAFNKAAANTKDGMAMAENVKKANNNLIAALSSPMNGRGSYNNSSSRNNSTINNYGTTPKKMEMFNFKAPGMGSFGGGSNSGGSRRSMGGFGKTTTPVDSATADTKTLQDAINARDKGSKEKYKNGEEGQSIFDIITNTYIRNYEKVLNKKEEVK